MVNYPSVLPQDALLILLDKVRGKDVSLAELVHAAWNVQGYAQAQFIGGGVAIGSTEVQTVSDEVLIEEALKSADPEADAKGFLPIPWILLAKLAIRIVLSAV